MSVLHVYSCLTPLLGKQKKVDLMYLLSGGKKGAVHTHSKYTPNALLLHMYASTAVWFI